MFYSDRILHAIVDAGSAAAAASENETTSSKLMPEGMIPPDHIRAPLHADYQSSSSTDVVDDNARRDTSLTRKQQQKAKRKFRKHQAKEMKTRHRQHEENLTKDKPSLPQNYANEAVAPPLRLHQFVSTVFRSELNVAENGTGYFVKNGPRVSAHHAILQGAVRLNGKVCKLGRTVLRFGDDVGLRLELESERGEGELVAWSGSMEAAKQLEGDSAREGTRKGRMMTSSSTETRLPKGMEMSDLEMVKYYREKLNRVWNPETQERVMARPLLTTLRALKPTARLASELRDLGFRPVSEEEDLSLRLSCLDSNETQQLSASIMRELLRDAWIAVGDDNLNKDGKKARRKRLGVFLSEARVTGEVIQQELTSMLPIAILVAHLMDQTPLPKKLRLRFLDLCAAPGSKTCQLLLALDSVMTANSDDPHGTDYTVVANEISPQRAEWMRQRLHQQSCGRCLSNLIVTCADGRAYANVDRETMDYVLCDVPCSGDGTVRKSPKILEKWSPKNAAKNKILQKELLAVGLGLLRPSDLNCEGGISNGGFLLYSTCSLNPLENEQVITEVMDELNEKEEGSFKYELVSLSEASEGPSSQIYGADCDDKNCNPLGRRNNNILRVLPAKSHGGFFIAGIRKLTMSGAGVDGTAAKPWADRGDVTINSNRLELIRRNFGAMNGLTMSYSISPHTRQCSADLIEKLGRFSIVSSGIAVLYESNDDGVHILQQGCTSLASQRHRGLVVAYIQLSPAEILESRSTTQHREILLPIDRVQTKEFLDSGMPLIIEVDVPTSACVQNFLLPARIVRVLKDGAASGVVAKILARPQIYKRSLSLPKIMCTDLPLRHRE